LAWWTLQPELKGRGLGRSSVDDASRWGAEGTLEHAFRIEKKKPTIEKKAQRRVPNTLMGVKVGRGGKDSPNATEKSEGRSQKSKKKEVSLQPKTKRKRNGYRKKRGSMGV